jgi:hypothetical protein
MHVRFLYAIPSLLTSVRTLKFLCKANELFSIKKKQENKLRGLSPRANYTDRATAACRRSYSQLFRIQGCRVVRAADPYGSNLDF